MLQPNTTDGASTTEALSIGAGTSSSARYYTGFSRAGANVSSGQDNTKVIAAFSISASATVAAVADLTSLDSGGFTLNWTTADATARVISYLVLGGSELTSSKITQFTFKSSAGSQAYTGTGFKPDVVLVLDAGRIGTASWPITESNQVQNSFGWFTASAQAESNQRMSNVSPSATRSRQVTSDMVAVIANGSDSVVINANETSMDNDGFTLNFTASNAASIAPYIALKGMQVSVGTITQPGSTGVQTIAGLSFTPAAVILMSNNRAAGTSVVATARQSMGWTDGTNQTAVWFAEQDNTVSPAEHTVLDRTVAIKMETEGTPTVNAAAAFSRWLPTGFEINWTAADATARQVLYVALGPLKPAVPPMAIVSQ
jgi:hypothetical protein